MYGSDESDEIIEDDGAEREPAQGLMRFTIIDSAGTVSFVAAYNALKALVAAVSKQPEPQDVAGILENANRYDNSLQNLVLDGLALFNEHNVVRPAGPGSSAFITAKATSADPTPLDDRPNPDLSALPRADEARVFRVVDAATRDASLQPVGTGLVIINLPAKRIIQVQNTFGFLKREDRGRFFVDGQPSSRLYWYRLPKAWSMLP